MSKITKPEYYQTPLRKKADIVWFILLNTSQRHYDRHPHPLCFNVKCHLTDLSFDNLLKLWKEYEGEHTYQKNEDWLKAAKERFAETKEETLWVTPDLPLDAINLFDEIGRAHV